MEDIYQYHETIDDEHEDSLGDSDREELEQALYSQVYYESITDNVNDVPQNDTPKYGIPKYDTCDYKFVPVSTSVYKSTELGNSNKDNTASEQNVFSLCQNNTSLNQPQIKQNNFRMTLGKLFETKSNCTNPNFLANNTSTMCQKNEINRQGRKSNNSTSLIVNKNENPSFFLDNKGVNSKYFVNKKDHARVVLEEKVKNKKGVNSNSINKKEEKVKKKEASNYKVNSEHCVKTTTQKRKHVVFVDSDIESNISDSDANFSDTSSSVCSKIFCKEIPVSDIKLNIGGNDDDFGDDDDDDVISVPSCSDDDDDKWRVSERDILGSRPHSFRYYKYEGRCRNCREKGHLSRDCPKPKVIVCYLCGNRDHISDGCPNTMCANCGQPGHLKDRCNKKFNRWVVCNRCSRPGHVYNNCPDHWRRFHLTTVGKPKKMKAVKMNRRMFCCNCGSNKHFAHDCTGRGMSLHAQIPYPFIISYSHGNQNTQSTTDDYNQPMPSQTNQFNNSDLEPVYKKRKIQIIEENFTEENAEKIERKSKKKSRKRGDEGSNVLSFDPLQNSQRKSRKKDKMSNMLSNSFEPLNNLKSKSRKKGDKISMLTSELSQNSQQRFQKRGNKSSNFLSLEPFKNSKQKSWKRKDNNSSMKSYESLQNSQRKSRKRGDKTSNSLSFDPLQNFKQIMKHNYKLDKNEKREKKNHKKQMDQQLKTFDSRLKNKSDRKNKNKLNTKKYFS